MQKHTNKKNCARVWIRVQVAEVNKLAKNKNKKRKKKANDERMKGGKEGNSSQQFDTEPVGTLTGKAMSDRKAVLTSKVKRYSMRGKLAQSKAK